MATRADIEWFIADELCDFVFEKLKDNVQDVEEIVDELQTNKISGKAFLELTDEDIIEMLKPIGYRKVLIGLVTCYTPQVTTVDNTTTCV